MRMGEHTTSQGDLTKNVNLFLERGRLSCISQSNISCVMKPTV